MEGSGWPGLMRIDIVNGANRSESPPIHAAANRSSKAAKRRSRQMKRRKRVAAYRFYGVEGRMKVSITKGFCWIKKKCSEIIHGY
ncbi:hypothetical protein SASPL_107248 [Salvia splendens]|uniref:Uncharacterized protein n=1 Tax=Salvia splendens TaxID=180675 RepID=A0A8X8YB08_SALSN|nr:hypothetical protein SASPL_107248 [Salvia splendens]